MQNSCRKNFIANLQTAIDILDIKTQAEIERFLGVSGAAVSKWLSGKSVPSKIWKRNAKAIKTLSEILRCSPDAVFQRKIEKPSEKTAPDIALTLSKGSESRTIYMSSLGSLRVSGVASDLTREGYTIKTSACSPSSAPFERCKS
jgi:transcriptional regulator with XRE-family HTH domain